MKCNKNASSGSRVVSMRRIRRHEHQIGMTELTVALRKGKNAPNKIVKQECLNK